MITSSVSAVFESSWYCTAKSSARLTFRALEARLSPSVRLFAVIFIGYVCADELEIR